MRLNTRRNDAFTIVELMIVVAIIAIVLSIAIPSLANSRKSATEGSAISSLRAITTVMEQYRTRFGNYPMLWAPIVSGGYLDGFGGDVRPDLEGAPNVGGKSGYSFLLSAAPGVPWRVFAVPNELGVTGDTYYYVDMTGVIRRNDAGFAGPNSPAI